MFCPAMKPPRRKSRERRLINHGNAVFAYYHCCTGFAAGNRSAHLLRHRYLISGGYPAVGAVRCICINRSPANLCGHEQVQPDRHPLFHPGRKPDEPGRYRQTSGRFRSGDPGQASRRTSGNKRRRQRAVWCYLWFRFCSRCCGRKHGRAGRSRTGL